MPLDDEDRPRRTPSPADGGVGEAASRAAPRGCQFRLVTAHSECPLGQNRRISKRRLFSVSELLSRLQELSEGVALVGFFRFFLFYLHHRTPLAVSLSLKCEAASVRNSAKLPTPTGEASRALPVLQVP